MDLTQSHILELLNTRNERGLELLTASSGRLLMSLARRILGSAADAEECVNDVLLEVWNTIPPKSPESVSSYACMLTRRTAIDRLRHSSAAKRGGGEYCASLDELEDIPAPSIDAQELSDAINDFLGGLSADDRLLFMGRYYDFRSVGELAAILKISSGAASLRLSRMRDKLRKLLTKRGLTI